MFPICSKNVAIQIVNTNYAVPLGKLLKELRLINNRTRQAAITKEILEIVGGAEALAVVFRN